MISPGDFTASVTIQKNIPTRSSTGSDVDAWSEYATVLGKLEPLGAREYFESAGTQAEQPFKLTSWYAAGVTGAMRLLVGARVFDIQGAPARVNQEGVGDEARGLFMVVTVIERD